MRLLRVIIHRLYVNNSGRVFMHVYGWRMNFKNKGNFQAGMVTAHTFWIGLDSGQQYSPLNTLHFLVEKSGQQIVTISH